MIDVTIMGGGNTGLLLAQTLISSGLNVVVVEAAQPKPDDFEGEWIHGFGTVSAPNFVAVVDPATGDERRLLSTRAIVISIGMLKPEYCTRMLGISKLGIDFETQTATILSDSTGRTKAHGIFVTGQTASCTTPDIATEIVEYLQKFSDDKS